MNLFRFLFPSFEKPIERSRYLNLEPETHEFRGVGTVLLLAATCGVALALWEPSQQVTSPFVTASVSRPTPTAANTAPSQETTAAADADEDIVTPTARLSTLCAQRATARRDCAGVKAFRDARLNAPDPVAVEAQETQTKPPMQPQPQVTAEKTPAAAKIPNLPQPEATRPAAVRAQSIARQESPAIAQPVSTSAQPETAATDVVRPPAPIPGVQPSQKTAAAPKARRTRSASADDAPAERLVKVQELVMPDGRKVPIYRRQGSGGYETGTIVDGEYRPSRRANLDPPLRPLFWSAIII